MTGRSRPMIEKSLVLSNCLQVKNTAGWQAQVGKRLAPNGAFCIELHYLHCLLKNGTVFGLVITITLKIILTTTL